MCGPIYVYTEHLHCGVHRGTFAFLYYLFITYNFFNTLDYFLCNLIAITRGLSSPIWTCPQDTSSLCRHQGSVRPLKSSQPILGFMSHRGDQAMDFLQLGVVPGRGFEGFCSSKATSSRNILALEKTCIVLKF